MEGSVKNLLEAEKESQNIIEAALKDKYVYSTHHSHSFLSFPIATWHWKTVIWKECFGGVEKTMRYAKIDFIFQWALLLMQSL